jgi:hypothetical protein
MVARLSFSIVLGVLLAARASVAGPIVGTRLDIKNPRHGLNKIVFKSKDSLIDSGNLGSVGDPRCEADGGGGGALRINGGPGNDLTIALPCAGWVATNGGVGAVFNTDYRYKDPGGTTCSRVVVKHGRLLRVLCKGAQVAYVLGTAQGDIDVTLRMGSVPVRDCATFGPPPTDVVRDGSDGRRYRAKDAPRPDACTSSPSGAFVDARE